MWPTIPMQPSESQLTGFLTGNGLEANFNLVKERLGDIAICQGTLDDSTYPYQELMNLFLKNKYEGWVLWNAEHIVKALISQREIFEKMTGKS